MIAETVTTVNVYLTAVIAESLTPVANAVDIAGAVTLVKYA